MRETADLLDLSTSELHRLERAQRAPSPRTRFRLLRLLTLPLPPSLSGPGFSPAERSGRDFHGEKPAGSSRCRRAGRVGTGPLPRACPGWTRSVAGRGAQARPKRSRGACPERSRGACPERSRGVSRRRWLDALKALLSLPPPQPIEFEDDPDCLHRLRYLWLTAPSSTRDLAALLDDSQPHLIRLLHGDHHPRNNPPHRCRPTPALPAAAWSLPALEWRTASRVDILML
ncbi:MAG: hypothetical protein ACE5IP_10260 [Terriglobia bacterium]